MIYRSLVALVLCCITTMTSLTSCIESFAVRIDSLPCRFCFPAIAKKMLTVKSIKKVSFTEANNTVHITLMDKNAFNPHYLYQLIEEGTNYRIKDIKITATGKIMKRGKELVLEMESNPRHFYLDKIHADEDILKEGRRNWHAHKEKKHSHEKGILARGRRAFEKTGDFFRGLFSLQSKNQPLLLYYAEKNMPVRITGSIHTHLDGSMWCTGSSVQIKEVTTPASL